MALRREHRFESFAPVRDGNLAKWCVPLAFCQSSVCMC